MQRSEAYLQHFELFEVFDFEWLISKDFYGFSASFFFFDTALNYYILTIWICVQITAIIICLVLIGQKRSQFFNQILVW